MCTTKKAILAMNEAGFSQRFLRCIPPYGHNWHFYMDNSVVNATIEFGEKLERAKSYFYGCGGYYLPHFRKYDVSLIYENEFFAIYSKIYKHKKSIPFRYRDCKKPIAIIVHQKRILATFPFDYESLPVLTSTKINVDGKEYEVAFLSYIEKKEAIAIICIESKPIFFTGLPFALDLVQGNEAVLHGGQRATISIELHEDYRGRLVFSF
jgi:hypothetical protein